ncbi:MAG: hypothetical protein AAGH99_07555 [Planctomycetota bacterium]
MIKFRCKTCQKKIGVKDEYAGRAIKCPGCETRIDIPLPEPQHVAEPSVPADLPDLAGLAALEDQGPARVRSVAAPLRTCPKCNATMSEDAVLCITCGHSLDGKRKSLNTQIIAGDDESPRKTTVGGMGRMALGLGAASGVAVLCGALWLVILFVSGYEVGLVAWIGGGLIGLTAGVIGRNPSPIYCGLTAGVAAASILGAKAVVAGLATLAVWGLDFVEEFSPENLAVHHAVMEEMYNEGVFTGDEAEYARITVAFFFSDKITDAQDFTNYDTYFDSWESVDNQVMARTEPLDENDREQILADAAARHANWDPAAMAIDDAELDAAMDELEAEGVTNSFGANFFLTLSLFDFIFFGLAVTTAYSVAYKQGV